MAAQEVIEDLYLVDVQLQTTAGWRSFTSLHFTIGFFLDREQAFKLRITLVIFTLEMFVKFGHLVLISSPCNFPFEINESNNINKLQALMRMRTSSLGALLIKFTIFLLAEYEDIGCVVIGVVA